MDKVIDIIFPQRINPLAFGDPMGCFFSTTSGWMDCRHLNFCTNTNVPLRMNYNNWENHLTFHLGGKS